VKEQEPRRSDKDPPKQKRRRGKTKSIIGTLSLDFSRVSHLHNLIGYNRFLTKFLDQTTFPWRLLRGEAVHSQFHPAPTSTCIVPKSKSVGLH